MWTSILLAQECLQLHPLPAWLYQWPDYQYVPPVWLSVRLQAQLCGERTWVANLCTRKGAGTGGANQGTGHSDTAAKDSAGRPQTSLDCEGINAQGTSSETPAPAVILWFNYCTVINYEAWPAARGRARRAQRGLRPRGGAAGKALRGGRGAPLQRLALFRALRDPRETAAPRCPASSTDLQRNRNRPLHIK